MMVSGSFRRLESSDVDRRTPSALPGLARPAIDAAMKRAVASRLFALIEPRRTGKFKEAGEAHSPVRFATSEDARPRGCRAHPSNQTRRR